MRADAVALAHSHEAVEQLGGPDILDRVGRVNVTGRAIGGEEAQPVLDPSA